MIKYPEGLLVDIAMNDASLGYKPFSDDDLMKLYNLTYDEFRAINQDPDFRREVRTTAQSIRNSGDTIKLKMKQQLELYIDQTIPTLMGDPEVSAKDKIGLLQFLGKGSGMIDDKPKDSIPMQQLPVFSLIMKQDYKEINGVTIDQIN